MPWPLGARLLAISMRGMARPRAGNVRETDDEMSLEGASEPVAEQRNRHHKRQAVPWRLYVHSERRQASSDPGKPLHAQVSAGQAYPRETGGGQDQACGRIA